LGIIGQCPQVTELRQSAHSWSNLSAQTRTVTIAARAPIGPYASGAPGIFIDQAARCGGRCIFAGAVGDDAFGQVILQRLKVDGVDTSLIAVVPGVPRAAPLKLQRRWQPRFRYNIVHSAASQFVADHTTIEKLVNFGTGIMHVSARSSPAPQCAKKCCAFARPCTPEVLQFPSTLISARNWSAIPLILQQ
jgi:sugar/nucleoside kinase (ribokinase family)